MTKTEQVNKDYRFTFSCHAHSYTFLESAVLTTHSVTKLDVAGLAAETVEPAMVILGTANKETLQSEVPNDINGPYTKNM